MIMTFMEKALNGGLDQETLMLLVGVTFSSQLIRYTLACIIPFFSMSKSEIWQKRFKIKQRPYNKEHIRYELKNSILTLITFWLFGLSVFGLVHSGYSSVYLDIDQYGVGYFLFSIVLFIFLVDAYIYWTHRLLHHPVLFRKIHHVHHHTKDASPLSSFCFHPLEAVIQNVIILVLLLFIPIHPLALLAFNLSWVFFDVHAHLGGEFFPRLWTKRPFRYFVSPTFHQLHHARNCGHYGFVFTYWDMWMKTFDEKKFNRSLEKSIDRMKLDAPSSNESDGQSLVGLGIN